MIIMMDPNRDPNISTSMVQASGTISTLTSHPSTTSCNKNKKSLGLLAEVAMKRIYEEQQQHNNDNQQMEQPKTKIINQRFSLEQIRKLSEKRLLNIFSEFKKDLKNKIYSYKCQILPQECQAIFECYNNETVVKNQIIDHLSWHLTVLEKTLPDVKIYSSRKAKIRNKVDKSGTTKKPATAKIPKNNNKKSKPTDDKSSINVNNPSSSIQSSSSSMLTAPVTTTAACCANLQSEVDIKLENDTKNNLALKLLAVDHAYTQKLMSVKKSETTDDEQDDKKLVAKLIKQEPDIKPELETLARKSTIVSISNNNNNLYNIKSNLPSQLCHPIKVEDDLVINDSMMNDVSQTVEIRTTPYSVPSSPVATAHLPQSQPQTVVLQPSAQMTTTTVLPADISTATMRDLALDYIDDIRRKSSSAAKSIIVNGDKSIIYQCKICPDKQFTSTNGLIFHYKKHAGLKPYVCELCSATFTRQHSLNYHMLIHLNKSRFVCSECGRHFRHPSHFKEHMRRHTGETPFQCSDCLIRFKTRNTYKRHLQTKHAKILTSKGIIELSNSSIPYQSNVAKSSAGSTGSSTSSSATATTVKPRRKYAIGYLHKNIETMSKYEQETNQQLQQQQQQQLQQQHQLQVSYPLKQGLASNPEGLDAATLTSLTLPASISPNGITILSIPSHQTMNTVHILDNNNINHGTTITGNYVRIQKPLVDLTDNVPIYQTHPQQQQQPTVTQQGHMTLVSYQTAPLSLANTTTGSSVVQSSGHHRESSNLTTTAMAMTAVQNNPQQHLTLKPMEPVASISGTDELLLNKQHHQQLSSSNRNAKSLDSQPDTSTNLTELTSVSLINDGSKTMQQLQAQQQQNPVTTISTTTTNDNFMRLLEAIAMTEDSTPN